MTAETPIRTTFPTPGDARLLSERETAHRLGMRPNTLAHWRISGLQPLPYVKIGRSIRYRIADVEAFIEARRTGAGTFDSRA